MKTPNLATMNDSKLYFTLSLPSCFSKFLGIVLGSVVSVLSTGLPASAQSPTKALLNSFSKPPENPILHADSSFTFTDPIEKQVVAWQKANVFNPGAIVKDNKVFMLYRCEDNPGASLGKRTSRIGLAESDDGIHFVKGPAPVLYPDNDAFKQYDYPGGCEDPRVVQTEDGTYVMTYTAWNYEMPRLSVAFSKDLQHWEKKGPVFAKAYQGKFLNIASKSGSIVTRWDNKKWVAAKIKGKYWMYWGDFIVNLAWSDNLIDWNPLLDSKGNLSASLAPRQKKFDSGITEAGPPAVITDKGIVLLYNGRNSPDKNAADPDLPVATYSVGQAIFDAKNPENLLERSETPFLRPTLPHETTGQYEAGTTFAEALIYFKNKWILYYGTADSYVGIAVANQ